MNEKIIIAGELVKIAKMLVAKMDDGVEERAKSAVEYLLGLIKKTFPKARVSGMRFEIPETLNEKSKNDGEILYDIDRILPNSAKMVGIGVKGGIHVKRQRDGSASLALVVRYDIACNPGVRDNMKRSYFFYVYPGDSERDMERNDSEVRRKMDDAVKEISLDLPKSMK